jgi:hypothetical protein
MQRIDIKTLRNLPEPKHMNDSLRPNKSKTLIRKLLVAARANSECVAPPVRDKLGRPLAASTPLRQRG